MLKISFEKEKKCFFLKKFENHLGGSWVSFRLTCFSDNLKMVISEDFMLKALESDL